MRFNFNKIIFLNGLENQFLQQIAADRVFSKIDKTIEFPEPVKNELLNACNHNPRLLLTLIIKTFEYAFKDKTKKIIKKYFEKSKFHDNSKRWICRSG